MTLQLAIEPVRPVPEPVGAQDSDDSGDIVCGDVHLRLVTWLLAPRDLAGPGGAEELRERELQELGGDLRIGRRRLLNEHQAIAPLARTRLAAMANSGVRRHSANQTSNSMPA